MHNAMETFLLTWKQPKAMPTNIRNPTRGLHVQLFIAIAMLQNKTSFLWRSAKILNTMFAEKIEEDWSFTCLHGDDDVALLQESFGTYVAASY